MVTFHSFVEGTVILTVGAGAGESIVYTEYHFRPGKLYPALPVHFPNRPFLF